MYRRKLLAAFGGGLLAGCSSQSADTTTTTTSRATTTPPPKTTAAGKTVETPEATETTTSEEPTTNGSETDTPEPTPTPFEQSVSAVREELRIMFDAYLAQGRDADSLTDVDAQVTDFRFAELTGPAGDAGDAIVEARAIADSDSTRALVNRLDGVRAFIWRCAQAQERLGDGYEAMQSCYAELDEEELTSFDRLESLTDLENGWRGTRASYREAQDRSEATDVASVEFIDEVAYEAKLEQLGLGVETLNGIQPTLDVFREGIVDLVDARDENDADEQQSRFDAENAAEHFEQAADDIEAVLRDGVSESMVRQIEDLSALAVEKANIANTLANS